MSPFEHVQRRMAIWLALLVIALACGLPLNATTIFWVGFMSIWVVRKENNG